MSSPRSLNGYIPATAFVMAKKAKPANSAGRVESKGSTSASATTNSGAAPAHPQITSHSTATTHLPLKPEYLFLEPTSEHSASSAELLQKMIDAMAVKRELVHIAKLEDFTNLSPATVLGNVPHDSINTIHSKTFGSKVVIALGEVAGKHILNSDQPLASLRGKVHFLKTGERVIATYHPTFLIQNPQSKKEAWEDLKLAMREMSAP